MTTDGQGRAISRVPNRLDRRKARTRAALVAAAQRLVSEQGRADVSIQEITEAADVGFGSFYNHFTSKDELFDAAVALTLEEHGALLGSAVGDMEDPAEVFSAGVRLTGRLQRTHPQMARILVRTGMPYLTSEDGLAPQAMRDLQAAADSGRLDIDDPRTAVAMAGGALLGVLQLLETRPDLDAERVTDQLAARLLRMFGLTRAEAQEIATRPLPALPALPAHRPG
ncbi:MULTISPECIES: TetR/AcrR family transcriptional regulator [Streptomyces]|uniref:TetR/AcrR family transcriptional regulator n=2 Tax=Streptomyces TaxID=1883 RepID=A0A3R7EQ91_9ACTN|nr:MULTISPECIES: TetR/AcrR family transcriptional regulator [Streptomyces]KNE83677.1 TetR family transcriptional regulator [Streptomyces fradiae]OFA51103.1 TetR family transcriptional regulator [Streptomyces fradiae]PQM20285.1 TetR/AcrR family transcriptional regulator [Streptomyces xinghaiensis]RKM93944.1 TetR/AcrR family transcriptional regulator [Streptomyces xinghaiensis]RNC69447.1 TetR/AcrR family transcriptional regulator [Streptomyces xinghaiensis]